MTVRLNTLLSSRPLQVLTALCLLGCWLPLGARAADFVAQTQAGERQISVETVTREGGAYVPLSSLVKTVGGAASVFPDRLQIDLGGKTAVIESAATRVSTSNGQFSLSKPLLLDLVDGYIAVEDLPAFFSNAFALQVRPAGAAPATPKSEPAPAPAMPELVEVEPLEPLSATPADTPLDETESLLDESGKQPSRAEPAAAMKGNVVILDAGHGGSDRGVESATGQDEKDLALSIVGRIQKQLEAAGGFTVALTRTEDVDMSTPRRVDFANDQKGSLFVSIHAGSSPSDRPHGLEVFYPYGPSGADGGRNTGRTTALLGGPVHNYSATSKRAADLIGDAVMQLSPAEFTSTRQMPLRLAKGLGMPCLLIEVGHLTNPTEDSLLATANYQDELAAAIASGIVSAFKPSTAREAAP